MYVEFEDDLLTGDPMIDSQHKELFDKINALLETCEQGQGKLAAIRTLDYLADYTDFHFTAEEKLQEEIGYPDIEEHKKRHQELRQVVTDLHEMLEDEDGPSDAFVEQVQKNVVQWLIYHIKGSDRSVAEYKNLRGNVNLL